MAQPNVQSMMTFLSAVSRTASSWSLSRPGRRGQPASGSPVDVRFASEVEREPVELLGLAETATAVARALSLGVFTADVIVDRQGMQWWVDINPDGLHIAADDADGTLLSALIHGLA
jgi:hypothetical protein